LPYAQIDQILDLLKNGKWHDLKEISQKTQLQKLKVELLADFLAEYNFIELNKEEQITRLTPTLLNFLNKIREVEERESLVAS